ncbi:MAG: biotin transporter BioY [Clostridia bacterium]|nr:biotin transporter BioY [Clostridia bacterium]
MKRIKTQDITLCAVFAALSAIGAFIKIPIPICPFTLQLTFTTLAGLLLGKKLGALSVAVYVFIGLLGIPVFTEGGGIYYVLKPTFGYLLGFIIGTYVTGAIAWGAEEPSYLRILLASVAGVVIDYIFGMVYMYLICNYVLDSALGFRKAIMTCFVLLIPKDIVLAAITSLIAKRLIPIFRRRRDAA